MVVTERSVAIPGERSVDVVKGQFISGVISQRQAAFLLKSIWPKAPDDELAKAALICQQYQLNPLMKQLYLIEFNKSWVTVLSIKATRQIAKKNGYRYTYIDGPRMMTPQEQEEILGAVDTERFWAITRVKDQDGNVYPGYGNIDRQAKVYGTDKGNTPQNLCFIRSERNAIDKMVPGGLPDTDVIDDQYTPISNLKVAVEEGRKEFQEQVKDDIDTFYPEDQQPATGQQMTLGPEQNGEQAKADIGYILDGMSKINWKAATFKSWLRSKANFNGLNLDGDVADILGEMTPDQLKFVRSELDQRAR